MTTDMERELRDLFREKAGEAPVATAPVAPQRVLRRGRRRQVGTVLGSAAVVLVLIVGSVAGLNAVLRGEEDPFTTGHYNVFERTATIEAFTVTSPSSWYLVNEWPLSMLIAVEGSAGASSPCIAVPGDANQECDNTPGVTETSSPIPVPEGLPVFQLSNVDLGLAQPACGETLPDRAAVLYVAYSIEAARNSGFSFPPWPGDGLGVIPGDGPGGGICGEGLTGQFSVNGTPFMAWAGFGSSVSQADRRQILSTYQSLIVEDAWDPAQPDEATPAYVIAGGTSESGAPWRLELRRGEQRPELSLQGTDVATLSGPLPETLTDSYYSGQLSDPIFGAVTKAASGVEFRPGTENINLDLGRSPVAGTIVPVPPSLGPFDFDLFFIDPPSGYGELGGRVIALGVAESSPVAPPAAEPRGEVVELSGTFLDQSWKVRFTGAFADETACIRARSGDADGWGGELCPRPLETSLAGDQPSLHVLAEDFALVVGSVPVEVVEIRFTSDNGSNTPSQFKCRMGPLGWTDPDRKVCAIALPSQESGTFEYLDARGMVLFEEGMGWGASAPTVGEPVPADPVQGGTYWAVYPWLGAARADQAKDVVQQIFDAYGIRASHGELACDRGAADALGTNAAWRVAVYFQTEDEASAFALQAGLLDHEARVIARVTTLCLD